jgi:hypothetical protein
MGKGEKRLALMRNNPKGARQRLAAALADHVIDWRA